MKKYGFALWVVAFFAFASCLLAQPNGDLTPVNTGSSGGGPSGYWSGGLWWYLHGPTNTICNPDTSSPALGFNALPHDDTADCPNNVPNAPIATAWDYCDGYLQPSYSAITNFNSAGYIESIVRTWSAADAAGNSITWKQTIKILDTQDPAIDVKAEIKVEVDSTGQADMPDFTCQATDDHYLASVIQTPVPGGKYKLGERQPVTLVATDGCGRGATNSFTAVFVCGGCPASCSAGSGTPNNGCVSLSLNLGHLANGRPAGYLVLYAQRPDVRIFSPAALRYYEGGAETIRDTNRWLRQIRSADVLVDIVPNGYAFSYDIRMYSPGNWGEPDEDGLYLPSGPAMLTWQVSAPHVLPTGDGGHVANPNKVSLVRVKDRDLTRYDYEYDHAQQGWSLLAGRKYNNSRGAKYWDGGVTREMRFSAWNADRSIRTETYVVEDTAGNAAYREVREYKQFPWGEAWVKSSRGEEHSARTTERGYYEDPLMPNRYARLAWERQPDGNFVWYDYDNDGRIVMEARVWKDTAVPVLESNALMAAAAVTLNNYSPVDSADDGTVRPRNPRTITELVANQVVSRTYYSYSADVAGEITEIKEECASPGAAFGAAGNRRTRTTFYSDAAELWPGRVKRIEHPDGRLDRDVLERGDYVAGGNEPGSFIAGAGDYIRTTEIHGTILHPEGTGKTTREISVRRILGGDVLQETYVFDGTDYKRVDWTVRGYDEQGHLMSENFANGLVRTSQWSACCGKESEVDVDGTRTFYEYDALERLATRTKVGLPKVPSATEPGYPEQPDIVTTYAYDGAGNVNKETQTAILIRITNSSQGVITQEIVVAEMASYSRYDLAGQIVESRDTSGLLTRYEYDEGGRIQTVVRPGGATEITENFPDGRTKSVTGTGVTPRFYDYGVNPDGSQWTLAHTGGPDSPMWEKTTTDMLGRIVKEEKPGFGGNLLTTTYEYNDKSQLVAVRQWSGDPPVTPIGVATLYEYDELGDQFRTAQDVNGNGAVDLAGPDRINETQTRIVTRSGERWHETVSKVYPAEGSAVPVAVSVQRNAMAGQGSGFSTLKSESVDVYGNKTATTQTVDPAQRIVTIHQNPPDSTVDAITVIRNGLVHSARPSIWRDPTYFAYDGLGRQIMTTDPRTGEQLTHYNDRNQVEGTRDGAGNWTHYQYDPDSGFQISVSNALGDTVYTAYDLQGRATNVWGATYPVAYEYDAYGRMAALKTWRDTNAAMDITRWFYDEATGLLTNKVYADGNGTAYEYDAVGRLTRRAWARGVNTDYAYDALGQLTNIDYSDDTPDVSFAYDRMGRQVTVTDVLGTRTNVYDPATFDLVAEQLPDGQTLARSYDRYGRPAGVLLGEGYQTAYAYDDVSRFSTVTATVNAVTTAYKYAYLAQSDLISRQTAREAAGGGVLLDISRVYEPRRDLVVAVTASSATSTLARYDYVNDRLGLRIARKDTIGIKTVTNIFGYNGRSELTTAAMGTDQFGYQYDAIGNRQVAVANDLTVQYGANTLNQYTSILPSAGTPAYDADGNMTSNGVFTYIWDAENRLAEVRSNGTSIVRNAYDFMGRRIQKATAVSTNRFLYDGWNVLRENLGAATPSSRIYVWGLDLSGSLQGAGGVGGLLAILSPDSGILSPVCDANGNVTHLVDTDGFKIAYYKYDPYGNLLSQSGPAFEQTPFRFSSKYYDDEPGLYYYGYRFYSPGLGRWINRDPIGEMGGHNNYGFVLNNPLGIYDALGMWGNDVHQGLTTKWASETGIAPQTAIVIGREDDHVDTLWDPAIISDITWGWHFNRAITGDTRFENRDNMLKQARYFCRSDTDKADLAAIFVGQSLHPEQDWVAHGDYNRREETPTLRGVVGLEKRWYWHNWGYGPWLNGSTSMPDETWRDADGSYDGRATMFAFNGSRGGHHQLSNKDTVYWVSYHYGHERINMTRERTILLLQQFQAYVKMQKYACKCRCQFIGGN